MEEGDAPNLAFPFFTVIPAKAGIQSQMQWPCGSRRRIRLAWAWLCFPSRTTLDPRLRGDDEV